MVAPFPELLAQKVNFLRLGTDVNLQVAAGLDRCREKLLRTTASHVTVHVARWSSGQGDPRIYATTSEGLGHREFNDRPRWHVYFDEGAP